MDEAERQRAERNAARNYMTFTDLGIRRLNVSKRLEEANAERRNLGLKEVNQLQLWDEGASGLSLLISAGGTKTFRVTFKLDGKWITHKLGRFGELVADADPNKENVHIADARERTASYRAKALSGIDPRKSTPAATASGSKLRYEAVVDEFIELRAKPRQRTWNQTRDVLNKNCKDWLKLPIEDIKKSHVNKLLDGFARDGHHAKAAHTYRWLKVFFKWAWKRDYVAESVIERLDFEAVKRVRDKVFSDADITAIWTAANGLDPVAGSYVKLLVLLAPRRTALAGMRRADLDDIDNPTLWTTPHEYTKSKKSAPKKREYLTPLPALAQRIVKCLPGERLFPTLRIHRSEGGSPVFSDASLRQELIKLGAPDDFYSHAMRHTVATWLQNRGHSEWEIGLVLNHAGSGVTAGYSHGYALDLKRKLLEEWAGHVERLVQPEGAALLR
jgi:integrase